MTIHLQMGNNTPQEHTHTHTLLWISGDRPVIRTPGPRPFIPVPDPRRPSPPLGEGEIPCPWRWRLAPGRRRRGRPWGGSGWQSPQCWRWPGGAAGPAGPGDASGGGKYERKKLPYRPFYRNISLKKCESMRFLGFTFPSKSSTGIPITFSRKTFRQIVSPFFEEKNHSSRDSSRCSFGLEYISILPGSGMPS